MILLLICMTALMHSSGVRCPTIEWSSTLIISLDFTVPHKHDHPHQCGNSDTCQVPQSIIRKQNPLSLNTQSPKGLMSVVSPKTAISGTWSSNWKCHVQCDLTYDSYSSAKHHSGMGAPESVSFLGSTLLEVLYLITLCGVIVLENRTRCPASRMSILTFLGKLSHSHLQILTYSSLKYLIFLASGHDSHHETKITW